MARRFCLPISLPACCARISLVSQPVPRKRLCQSITSVTCGWASRSSRIACARPGKGVTPVSPSVRRTRLKWMLSPCDSFYPPSLCVGCGMCESVCKAVNDHVAIRVRPARQLAHMDRSIRQNGYRLTVGGNEPIRKVGKIETTEWNVGENLYQFALDIAWTFTYHTQARVRNARVNTGRYDFGPGLSATSRRSLL